MKANPRYVACPRCGAQVPWVESSRFRPFCSERCKTVDLGAWATEQYRVAAATDEQQETAPPPPDAPAQ
jgi:endogenous inhibitor of DNA gyrase (YacG/DUF329 family)